MLVIMERTLPKTNMSYPFFALEGCDGVGKSTIRTILMHLFKKHGIPCTSVGQHSWLDPWTTRLIVEVRERRCLHAPSDILAAYFHDKQLHSQNTILPAQTDSIVLADRYIFSDAVYQEVLYDIPATVTLEKHWLAGTLLPQAIIFVTTKLEDAVIRIANRSKHTRHYERPADMERIMASYANIFIHQPLFWLPPQIIFDNSLPNIEERVCNELFPEILKFCPNSRDTFQTTLNLDGDLEDD